MAFRLSNSVIGILNAITLLLSIPILAAGIWLGHRSDGTECERYLSAPVIAVGAFLLAVSLAGLVGACCRVTWLLWVYLLAMFVLIVVLFGITVFAFVVTNKGAGEAVSGRGFKEYRLGDYSNWLQNRVENSKNWGRIRSCLQDSKVCQKLQAKNETLTQFMASDLSPIEELNSLWRRNEQKMTLQLQPKRPPRFVLWLHPLLEIPSSQESIFRDTGLPTYTHRRACCFSQTAQQVSNTHTQTTELSRS